MTLSKEQVKELGMIVVKNDGTNKWQAEQHALLLTLVLKKIMSNLLDDATAKLVINDFYITMKLEGVGLCNASQCMQFLGLKAKEKAVQQAVDVDSLLAKFGA